MQRSGGSLCGHARVTACAHMAMCGPVWCHRASSSRRHGMRAGHHRIIMLLLLQPPACQRPQHTASACMHACACMPPCTCSCVQLGARPHAVRPRGHPGARGHRAAATHRAAACEGAMCAGCGTHACMHPCAHPYACMHASMCAGCTTAGALLSDLSRANMQVPSRRMQASKAARLCLPTAWAAASSSLPATLPVSKRMHGWLADCACVCACMRAGELPGLHGRGACVCAGGRRVRQCHAERRK